MFIKVKTNFDLLNSSCYNIAINVVLLKLFQSLFIQPFLNFQIVKYCCFVTGIWVVSFVIGGTCITIWFQYVHYEPHKKAV